MSEIVERVARALCPVDPNSDTEIIVHGKWYKVGVPHWKSWIGEARMVITAMREPTDTMCAVGQHINSEWLNDNAPIDEGMYRAPAKAVYVAMIDAALK